MFIAVTSIIIMLFIIIIMCGVAMYADNKRYKRACETQNLMFNQLEKGNFLWHYGTNINGFEICDIDYHFDSDNICRSFTIRMNLVKGEMSLLSSTIDVEVEKSKTYKYGNYYSTFSKVKMVKEERNNEIERLKKC